MSGSIHTSSVALVLRILNYRERGRFVVVLGLIFIGSLLEMVSLGIVIPVVQTVIDGDQRAEHRWLPEWTERLSYPTFVQVLMLSLVIAFLFKNVFLVGSAYFQQRFQLSLTNRVMQRLFETYLRQPYEFHLTNSSAVLVRNTQEYSAAVVANGVGPLLAIVTELLTGVGLIAILFVVEPLSTAVLLAMFGFSGCTIIFISRARTRRWGAQRVKHRGVLMEMLLAGLGGIKEIQLFGRDREVVETHRRSLQVAARSFYMFNVLQGIPRAAMEVVAVGGVALLMIVASVTNQDLADASLVVALFGVVAFRMLPSVSRVIQSLQQLSFGRLALEGAVEGLSLPQPLTNVRGDSQGEVFRTLEIADLRYQYPGTSKLVTDIVSLRISAGESVGIIGESGSGKSTLVDLLIGILTPQAGVLRVNGQNVRENLRFWQDRIGYVPQHVFLMDTSIRQNVAFGIPSRSIDEQDVERALRSANLWEFVMALPEQLDTIVGERGVRLSGGQRQRLGIARALYGNPEVIVLDEATSALDTETEKEIVESFREIAHDHTLIVVAHRTSTLAHCSRLIRLENGRIVQDGTYEEVVGSLSAS